MSASTELTTASVGRAAALARRGSYDLALAVLSRLGGRESTDPEVLDVLARVHAQRDELEDADRCWELALRLDPDHAGALAGRKRIAALTAPRVRPRVGRAVIVVLVAATAVTGAGVVGGLIVRSAARPDPAVAQGVNQIGAAQQDQAGQLNDINQRLNQDALRQQQTVNRLTAALAGDPRLAVRVSAGTVYVVFTDGVFQAGDQLSEGGSAALDDLAHRLRPSASAVTITIVGHTDDAQTSGRRYRDNVDLGVTRAQVAAERMSGASGLPVSTFGLSSAGVADPPYPNTTDEGRARNRTVTITIQPR